MTPRFEILISALLLVLLPSLWWLAGNSFQKPSLPGPAPRDRVSVMAFNVENLFDTLHDPPREDYNFLPLQQKRRDPAAQAFCRRQFKSRRSECLKLDWNDQVLAQKIKALASVILQVRGQGPDILILAEVENRRVLELLRKQGLGSSGYRTLVLIEGRDRRGIDVAVLSRFPLQGKAQLHPKAGARGILQVPLLLPSQIPLQVFALHLPSQAQPSSERQQAVEQFLRLVKLQSPQSLWIAGGDWNITQTEDRRTGLLSKTLARAGILSHDIGCRACPGTHFYRGVWNFFDILVFSKNLVDPRASLRLLPNSVQTPTQGDGQADPSGRPLRFNPISGQGASDHLPIYAELLLQGPEFLKKF